MTAVVKNDTLRYIETRAATTGLHSSLCPKLNLDSSAFAKEGFRFAQPDAFGDSLFRQAERLSRATRIRELIHTFSATAEQHAQPV
jgi:hypothetical protein